MSGFLATASIHELKRVLDRISNWNLDSNVISITVNFLSLTGQLLLGENTGNSLTYLEMDTHSDSREVKKQ